MVTELSLLNWVSLIGALVLFLGPGFALLSFYPARDQLNSFQRIGISFGFSLAFWSIALAWLHLLNLRFTPVSAAITLGAGWLITVIRSQPRRFLSLLKHWRDPGLSGHLILWGILFLTASAGILALRGIVAGPGSDSYHHTLISQMIVDRGALPDDFQPLEPIATFTYHFGFHGWVAAVAWLTGLQPLILVPLLGQILTAVSALSVAFFTQASTHSQRAGVISALITGLVSVFPAYLINWGRFTQLAGLVLLPLFLGLIWIWQERDDNHKTLPFIGILAAGISLTHYRVALMAAIGAAALLLFRLSSERNLLSRLKLSLWRSLLAVAFAGLLISPWIWHSFKAHRVGYPIQLGIPQSTYFSLNRLGTVPLHYASNSPLILFALLGIALGWWQRKRVAIFLSSWIALMLFLSTPRIASVYMDRISTIISLYIPASILIAWVFDEGISLVTRRFKIVDSMAWFGIIFLAILGAKSITSILEPTASYVGREDLRAMEWIRENTPVSSNFMVNTHHWDFLPEFVFGSDAGYWLPLLSGRKTITSPIIYAIERSTIPDFIERITTLDQLAGHLTTPEALDLLERRGITHVYVGQRGGPIVVEELLNSLDYKLLYKNDSVHVFRFERLSIP
jgi:hypothetical protein